VAGSGEVTALTSRAEDYLRLRRALGTKLTDNGPLLASFTSYLDERAETVVTVNTTLAWAARDQPASRSQLARRIAVVRGFAAYLRAFDPATEVPPGYLLPAGPTRAAPHIYTEQEIVALIGAARRLLPELHGAGLATLIGVMATAGLRTGEALRLDRDDVELTTGTLSILKSKWGKSRRIPLHASAVNALDDYLVVRDRCVRRPVDPALLMSSRGARLTPAMLHRWFPVVRADARIMAGPGQRPPRLYDLRHTFAVRTLQDWHAAGIDVRRQLPVLSTYLGHVNPNNTYWYLQATPELMGVLADRVAAYLDGGQ
jgi:integrase/recombinase XerD